MRALDFILNRHDAWAHWWHGWAKWKLSGCLFHRWDEGRWVGGIADPLFQFECLRCGAFKVRRIAP